MGKVWSFVLAVADLGVLAIFVWGRGHDMLRDASLLLIFAVLAVLVWVVALTTALHSIFTRGSGWMWAFALILFCWVPVLPALLFGLGGIFDRRVPAAPVKVAPALPVRRGRRALPPVDRRVVAAARSMRA